MTQITAGGPGLVDGFTVAADSPAALVGILVLLALVDATSFGTLLIPVWLLMAPGGVRPGRVLSYLGTILLFYFAVGLLIMFGADAFLGRYGAVLETRGFVIGQFLLGAALLAISFPLDSKKARARAAEQAATGGGRLSSWRSRAMGGGTGRRGSLVALMVLALTAGLIELASMIPYLAGIGMISSQGPSWPMSGLLLLGYCLVMIAPAVILLAGRLTAARALDTPLKSLDRWLTKNAASTTAWVIGIVGVLLALDAGRTLGWFAG